MVLKFPRLIVPLVAISIMVVGIGLSIGMVSCSKTAAPEEKYFVSENMGKIISVDCDVYHGTTTIRTEFWSIPVRDSMLVPIGKEVFMMKLDRGISDKYITWEGSSMRYPVYESNIFSIPLTEN